MTTGIRQVWRERRRVEGEEQGQRGVGAGRKHWYAESEKGDAQVGRLLCAETQHKSVERVLGQ